MIKSFESIILASQDATKLADFYKEKVGLKQTWDAVMGEDSSVYGFTLGETDLVIMNHSDINGKSKDPARIMFNLETNDIDSDFDKLKEAGVEVISEVYHIEEYGYVATFEDLDGNYFQLVKIKE